MKVIVDQEGCIGCGMCIDICPKGFKYNEDDKSEVIDENINEQLKGKISEAAEACPVEAIQVEL